MYILYLVCSGYCNRLNRRRARRRQDGEGASAGSEGDAGAGGEDDKDDNGPVAANEEDNAGEASGADSATTLAVSGCQESRRRFWPAAVFGLIRVWPGPTDSESRMPDGTAALCAEQ
jgi:hypothetical protein